MNLFFSYRFFELTIFIIQLDVDECEEDLHNCTDVDICRNRFGSFRCDCITGYQRRNANSQCEGEDIKSTFRFSVVSRHYINLYY